MGLFPGSRSGSTVKWNREKKVPTTGTILFLQAHKQRMKLQMFTRLWRILNCCNIAIAAYFVVSSLSLSNRGDEGEF